MTGSSLQGAPRSSDRCLPETPKLSPRNIAKLRPARAFTTMLNCNTPLSGLEKRQQIRPPGTYNLERSSQSLLTLPSYVTSIVDSSTT